jgi:drug/metabolite transporter (DMT)-like permease
MISGLAMEAENPLRGAALLTGAALLFAALGALVKRLSADLPNETIVFARNAMAAVALVPWLWRGGVRGVATGCFRLHLVRAVSGLSAMYCYFWAIAHLNLAEAVLLTYSSPLFIPFIARAWLGEPLPPRFGWAIGLGFAGIALILKPGPGMFEPRALVGVAAGVLTATAFVSIRRLTREEPTLRIVFWFGVLSTGISAAPLLWGGRMPETRLWAWLVLMGVLAVAGQFLLARAYALAPAARIGPFSYVTVVFGALLGWAFWGEIPGSASALGTVLVCLAGILAIRGSRRMAPAPPPPPREASPAV